MPKVILEFDSIEDSEELNSAMNGSKWKNVVWELNQYLRNKIKHPSDSMTDELLHELEQVRTDLHNIIHENQLYLE